MMALFITVIPAQAGISLFFIAGEGSEIPACAGMTIVAGGLI